MTHYIHLFFSTFFAWAIVIFAVLFVVSALSDLSAKVDNYLHKNRTPNAETPSVSETLSAIHTIQRQNRRN